MTGPGSPLEGLGLFPAIIGVHRRVLKDFPPCEHVLNEYQYGFVSK